MPLSEAAASGYLNVQWNGRGNFVRLRGTTTNTSMARSIERNRTAQLLT